MESAAALLRSLTDELSVLLPAGSTVIDAHTHLGDDEDGHSQDLPSLLGQLDALGPNTRACVFALHDPTAIRHTADPTTAFSTGRPTAVAGWRRIAGSIPATIPSARRSAACSAVRRASSCTRGHRGSASATRPPTGSSLRLGTRRCRS